jgi:hypothetical protein
VKHRLSAEVKTTASLIIDNPASVEHRLSAEVKTTASLIITSADKRCFTDAGLSIMSEAVVFTSADK